MMKFQLLLLTMFLGVSAFAETVKDREGAVRQDRANLENDARWIYNDFRQGLDEAKKSGKPLLVVLRCIPCLACAGIDAQVLSEPSLAPLLDQFICVRVMNANALDLSLFQVDYDLSFSAVMMNGDGTIYGRFGSWAHQKNSHDQDTASFVKALKAVLELHQGYPGNRTELAGKQGAPMPFKTPLEIPELADRYTASLDWQGKVVQSCVHCHQVGDAIRSFHRARREPIPTQWIYPWPAPETVGLQLSPDDIAKIEKVVPASPAAQAGLASGDKLIRLAGQPLVSIADVSWVLHRTAESGSVPGVMKRGDQEHKVVLELPSGWRNHADISRRVGTWGMRAMALGGLVLVDLTDEERARQDLDQERLALKVTHAGQHGKHAAAMKAGFRKDDVILKIDDISRRLTESELIGRLLREHQPGEQVECLVLRGDERLLLSLPMQ